MKHTQTQVQKAEAPVEASGDKTFETPKPKTAEEQVMEFIGLHRDGITGRHIRQQFPQLRFDLHDMERRGLIKEDCAGDWHVA